MLCGSLSARHVADGGDDLQILRLVANNG